MVGMVFVLPLTEDAEPSLPRLSSWQVVSLLNVDSGELGLKERGVATAPRSWVLQGLLCQKEEVYHGQNHKGQNKPGDVGLQIVKTVVNHI